MVRDAGFEPPPIDDFPSKSEHAMIGDNMRKLTHGRPERSALRTVRPCRPKESKDVFETMKKLDAIFESRATVMAKEGKSASLASPLSRVLRLVSAAFLLS